MKETYISHVKKLAQNVFYLLNCVNLSPCDDYVIHTHHFDDLAPCDDYVIHTNDYDHHLVTNASDIKIFIRSASFESNPVRNLSILLCQRLLVHVFNYKELYSTYIPNAPYLYPETPVADM